MAIPIQLAIQGGGAKITHLFAALEAVQTLERDGVLRVTRIAGTSAGAIAGAVYAAGVDMQRARDAFEASRRDLLRAFPPTHASVRAGWKLLTRQPFWDASPLRRLLVQLLSPRDVVGDLEIPLVIVASDLTNMQPCVYDRTSDPLISSLMDSAAIPFLFRTALGRGQEGYRLIVDGGVCENLPSEKLVYSAGDGEVIGITFGATRRGEPLTGYLDFAGALLETALNASVLRSQIALGLNNFVIRTEGGSFDFRYAFERGLGAEYRETRLRADEFFRRYAGRVRQPLATDRVRDNAPAAAHAFPTETRLHEVIRALRSMYAKQQEPIRFEMLSLRIIVTGCSQAVDELKAADQIRHELVFRASKEPISCYKIRLTSASPYQEQKTQCDVFDRDHQPVPFDLVPMTSDQTEGREYLLFFHQPIAPGDSRGPITLRVRDTVSEALKLTRDGRDELLTRASRADRPVARIEIVVHLPEELATTVMTAAPESCGARMSPAELTAYAAPAGFVTLGWKGEHVPPNTLFGCNLLKPEGGL